MDNDPIVSRTVIDFNSIYVIESLPDGALKTGRDLYDSIVFPESGKLAGIHTQFSTARTPDEFGQRLAAVGRNTRLGNHKPIVHIEAHGTDDGIELADGAVVQWRELIGIFGDINQACGMNLIVVAISCSGWNLTASLVPSDRAPVNMVIGPVDTMKAGELLKATQVFYRTLYATLDLNSAIEAMNDNRPYAEWRIKPGLAEVLFCRVFRTYVKELGTSEVLQQREDKLVAQAIKSGNVGKEQLLQLRLSIRKDLRDHRKLFEHFRRIFLMLDIFPERADRYGLTYDLCFDGSRELR